MQTTGIGHRLREERPFIATNRMWAERRRNVGGTWADRTVESHKQGFFNIGVRKQGLFIIDAHKQGFCTAARKRRFFIIDADKPHRSLPLRPTAIITTNSMWAEGRRHVGGSYDGESEVRILYYRCSQARIPNY